MGIRRLFPRAAVVNRQFRWRVRNVVAEERIHRPLQLQEHLIGHHPPHGHAGRVESLFYALQNGFELRDLIFVFATACAGCTSLADRLQPPPTLPSLLPTPISGSS